MPADREAAAVAGGRSPALLTPGVLIAYLR
jgi:hypothetical protein